MDMGKIGYYPGTSSILVRLSHGLLADHLARNFVKQSCNVFQKNHTFPLKQLPKLSNQYSDIVSLFMLYARGSMAKLKMLLCV